MTIQNVVLIDRLSLDFRAGLSALTGETGAGKSILLDSLGLALGARSEAGLVRAGTEAAQVAAEFTVEKDHPVYALLAAQGIAAESGEAVILRRTVGADGRSRAFINDQPVSVGLLRQAGESLVEIHGQFDTQSLLNPKEHRGLLDAYGTPEAERWKTVQAWSAWKDKEAELAAARERAEKARAEEAYLRAAVEDLDDLAPKVGEAEELAALRDKLMRRESTLENLGGAQAAAEEIERALASGWRALERIGDDAAALLAGMDRINAELQEILAGVESLSADLESSEYSLSEIDDRLFALKGQARKHGCDVDALADKRDELVAALDLIIHQDDVLGAMAREAAARRDAYVAQAEKIRALREKAAGRLDKLVAKELPPLKLDKARFETAVEALPDGEWGPEGMDRVQFLVATNPGAAAGPLGKIASGGEMARFMLALKVVLAEVGAAGTLVFDEVDSGIGGATADAVGERLARLSAARQILVVTHSPQVAARAAHHWVVAKGGAKKIVTDVVALPSLDARREEIARMLSGASVTEEARAAAVKLLEGRAA